MNLRYLNLDNNELAEIPSSFAHLKSLHHLRLRRNQLVRLPSSLGHLSSLKTLSLEDNQLTESPLSFDNLRLKQRVCPENPPLQEGEQNEKLNEKPFGDLWGNPIDPPLSDWAEISVVHKALIERTRKFQSDRLAEAKAERVALGKCQFCGRCPCNMRACARKGFGAGLFSPYFFTYEFTPP